jgi:predicted permease
MLLDLAAALRLAARRLWRRPAFTLFCGILCATATGATLTLFAVAKSVLFDPLPLPAPDRLVALWGTLARFDVSEYPYSWPNFSDTRAALLGSFDELAAVRSAGFTLSTAEEPVRIEGARVSRHFLRTLGLRPALGADFADDTPAASVLLGHELWRTRFARDPTVVGRVVGIDGTPHEVLGVLPPGLRLPPVGTDLLVPFDPSPGIEERRENNYLRVIGRLRGGLTFEAASAELLAVSERLAQEYPDANRELRARLVPLHEQMVAGSRASLRMLLCAVGVVFGIACGNVALLQVAAGVARRQELALRVALGARARGLLGLQVAESALLAAGSGLLGLGLAAVAARLLRGVDPAVLPRAAEVSLDPAAAAVTVGAVLVATVIFGVAPALGGLRTGTVGRNRGFGTRRAEGLQATFVAVQVALSVVLVLLAFHLLTRYAALARVDPGFRLAGVVSASTALSGPRHATPEQRARAIELAVDELAATPGVDAAGAMSRLPFTPGNSTAGVQVEDSPSDEPGANANTRWVSAEVFRLLGIPLLRGRVLDERDDADAPLVVVIDETLAEALGPEDSKLGRRVKLGAFDGWWEIVGVVAPVRVISLDKPPEPTVWMSLQQNPFPNASREPRFVVTTSRDPGAFATEMGLALRRALPDQAVHQVQPLADHLRHSLFDRRLVLHVTLAFAASALVLAAIGTYSLVSFRAAQRRREWALRAALGAAPRRLLGTITGSVLAPVGAGLLVGAALAAAVIWRLRGDAIGSPSIEAALGAFLALIAAAVFAALLPGWRAAGVDPAPALRREE